MHFYICFDISGVMPVKAMIYKGKSAIACPLPQGERDSLPEAARACANSCGIKPRTDCVTVFINAPLNNYVDRGKPLR